MAAVITPAMGFIGRYPIAIAAGLGLNGMVAFQLAGRMSWPAAMGIVVIEGLAITALVLLGFRERVFDAVPLALKQAISVGIGLFIAFIGFVDAGFVRRFLRDDPSARPRRAWLNARSFRTGRHNRGGSA